MVWLNSLEASTAPSAPCGTVTITPTRTPTVNATPTCVSSGSPGPWAVGANYPWGLTDVAVASDGTTVYGFGGRLPNGDQGVAYKYAGTGNWDPIANLPAAMSGAEAEYGHNGKIYVVYGAIPYIYDIGTNSWSSGAPGPQSYTYFAGHAYWDGKVYVIGGIQSGYPVSAVYAYDIATGSWSTLAPLPQAEYGMASAAINGKIYVANGNTGGSVTNNLFIYDIATNTWSTGPPSPLASDLVGGTVIEGKLYMIGGDPQGSWWGYTSNTYLYDPVSNSWSTGPSLNVARSRGNAATINTPGGQTAVVVGGAGGGSPWLNGVEGSTEPLVPCSTATVTPTRTLTPTATATCMLPGWTSYPNPAPAGDSVLNGVTALAPNDLWAVGAYTATGTFSATTLTVHSNGTSWTYIPSANPPSSKAVLQGVAGVASNDVWAVGYTGSLQTLTEHWNGTAWSIVPSPNPTLGPNRLFAVTAIASNNVWAVGWTGNTDFPHDYALIEHWDGSSWSLSPNPGSSTTGTPLYGVAATGANDVWAVGGNYPELPAYGRAYIEHWDGSAWSTVSNPADFASSLYAVTAVATNNVWAVGYSGGQTLIEHWDGSAWSIVPGPNPGATINRLHGVSARAANDVWAVGETNQASGGVKTFALHWDGSSWTQVATPDSATGRDRFLRRGRAGERRGVGGGRSGLHQRLHPERFDRALQPALHNIHADHHPDKHAHAHSNGNNHMLA